MCDNPAEMAGAVPLSIRELITLAAQAGEFKPSAIGGMTVTKRSQNDLNSIWTNIIEGKYRDAKYKPERITSNDGTDIMSIPNSDGTDREVYERKNGGQWEEVPFIGGESTFA